MSMVLHIMHNNISAITHGHNNISANIKGSITSKNLIQYAQQHQCKYISFNKKKTYIEPYNAQ